MLTGPTRRIPGGGGLEAAQQAMIGIEGEVGSFPFAPANASACPRAAGTSFMALLPT